MNTIVQTPTDGSNSSLEFYNLLEFKTILDENKALVSDGKVFIQINSDRYARPGIKLYKGNWDNEIDLLKKYTPVVKTAECFLLTDGTGIRIHLINGKSPVPENLPPITPSLIGNFAGIGLEVISIEDTSKIWKTLGFAQTSGSADQGWLGLENVDGMAVNLMKPLVCPHLFFNPSLTYFNGGQNLEIIAGIKKQKIPITEEITVFNKDGIVDNIIIRDPGGFGFFIFND